MANFTLTLNTWQVRVCYICICYLQNVKCYLPSHLKIGHDYVFLSQMLLYLPGDLDSPQAKMTKIVSSSPRCNFLLWCSLICLKIFLSVLPVVCLFLLCRRQLYLQIIVLTINNVLFVFSVCGNCPGRTLISQEPPSTSPQLPSTLALGWSYRWVLAALQPFLPVLTLNTFSKSLTSPFFSPVNGSGSSVMLSRCTLCIWRS